MNVPTPAQMKAGAALKLGRWTMFWSRSQEYPGYRVQPQGINEDHEGDHFTRYADALQEVKRLALAEYESGKVVGAHPFNGIRAPARPRRAVPRPTPARALRDAAPLLRAALQTILSNPGHGSPGFHHFVLTTAQLKRVQAALKAAGGTVP